MDTRTATLMIRYKAPDGIWRRAAVATGGNGRVRQGYAVIGGDPVKVADFATGRGALGHSSDARKLGLRSDGNCTL